MNLRELAAGRLAGLRGIRRRPGSKRAGSPLPPSQAGLLLAIARGATLKSHRYLNGGKEYRLHRLDGEESCVPAGPVRSLEAGGYLVSNHKFPAAVLYLTGRGREVAQAADSQEETAGG